MREEYDCWRLLGLLLLLLSLRVFPAAAVTIASTLLAGITTRANTGDINGVYTILPECFYSGDRW